ncbi:hypothetical protein ESP50_10225 [Agromyces atrinae]|nr:hypothetical protein ESP50_10225 [Agromyces atrinae]
MLESDPFSYRLTQAGGVVVSRGGRPVVTVGGSSAAKLAAALAVADDRTEQLLLARVTGNYKRGNERR